jgi:hypothetical protein
MKKTTRFFTGIVIMTVLLTAIGYACPISTTIKVTATNGSDIGSQEFAINIAEADDWFEWTLDGERDIVSDNGNLLGSIKYLKLKVLEDPATSVEFSLDNYGDSAIIAKVTVDTITFDPITNPEAYASASMTLTDRNQDGATITGLYDGKAYRAVYNGSSVYANLVDSFTAGTGKTVTQSEDNPLMGGTDVIADTLSSINASFKFTLSAGDSVDGTSYFEVFPVSELVVPEPATICLLGLGALSLIRRKK